MRLKSLELYGFKSFAEKTTLTFDDNFAAIVGPNGSGKSNLSDAVRWVLGEQSARVLRGDKMEDVIFSGASAKSPMNLAQVDLTFDNTDASIPLPYDTVTVSRKVYRNGESQYLVNRQPVRRKDVVELFLDTGVGKEGYSIIGQGRIDEILSTRSEDRRAVFEEAAGIAKFKFKKTESERRLQTTESQLEQVAGDLKIRQQEMRLLEKQAQQAKEGMRLVRELDVHELSLLEQERAKLRQSQENLSADLAHQKELQEQGSEKLRLLNEELQPYEIFESTYQEQTEQLRESVRAMEQILQKQETTRRVAEEKQLIYSQSEKRLLEEQEKAETQREQHKKKILTREEEVKALKENEKTLRKNLESFEAETMPEKEDHALLEARCALQKAQEAMALLHFRQQKEEEQDQLLREEQRENASLFQQQKAALLQIQNEQEEKQNHIAQITMQGKTWAKELEEEEQNLRNLQLKRDEQEESKKHLFSERATLSSRTSLLQSWMAQHEGYGRAVQNLLRLSDRDESIRSRMIGALADLIHVRAGYETAIQVALGGALQNIVVPNEQDAKYLIGILKQKQLGRVTFLPLDKISGSVPERAHAPEELMNGVDAVEYPPELEGIVTHFLARTSLVQNIDDAISLSHRRNVRNRIVSLDGDIINSWGSMVGGRRKEGNDATLLNRESELDHLQKQIQAADARMQILEQQQSLCEQEIQQSRDRKKKLTEQILQAREELMQTQSQSVSLRMQEEQTSREISQLEVFLEKSTGYDPQLFTREEQRLQQDIEDAQRALQSEEQRREETERQRQEKERDRALLSNRLSYAVRDREMAENRLAEAQEQLELLEQQQEQRNRQLQEARDVLQKAQSMLQESRTLSQQQREEKKTKENALQELQEKAQEQNSALSGLRKEKATLTDQLQEISNTLYRLELQAEQLSQRENELLENYRSSHDLSVEMVDERLSKLVPVATSKQKVNEIRQQLARIGYFNVETIDQFEEVSQEVNFLQNQLEDLHQSESDIRELIRDLDQTMQELFSTSFTQVREEYNRIFQILFHGGHANLRLEGEDVLTAGVEIEAQPPGKKLQSLNLLSGGERSMTALALLFAIFSIHPTPFCILDEIDAALDEANIGRYVEYLKTLKDATQFIIITHRKTTMQLAETLYGVTMQEGVSQIVKLRLSDYEEAQ